MTRTSALSVVTSCVATCAVTPWVATLLLAACGEDACPPGQTRVAGACRGTSAGAGPADCGASHAVRINEVLFNPAGAEGEGRAFIELRGPAGATVTNWQVRRVRSNGARDGKEITLTGAVGPGGYYVIGESATVGVAEDGTGGVAADQVDAAADGTNTSYAFVLLCGGEVVDAVAYGGWDPANVEAPFPGEAAPAPGVGGAGGASISRCPDGADTGDNARDFATTPPSPGAASAECPPPPPVCPPGARAPVAGDLLINEIAARKVAVAPGADAEFVEVVNVADAVLDLTGHQLAWNPGDGGAFSKSLILSAGTCLSPRGALLLWGGAAAPPAGAEAADSGVRLVPSASPQIRDSDGEFRVLAPPGADGVPGATLDRLCYNSGAEGCPTQPAGVSLTRDPDADPAAAWLAHDKAARSGGAVASPGACQNGDPFSSGCLRVPPPPVVEPDPACADPAPTGVVVNEVGFDPATGGWEFAELYNPTPDETDLAGWTVSDAVGVKHTFAAGTKLPAGGALVLMAVAACPAADAQPPPFEAGVAWACTGSLGFNNGGDTVTLHDAAGQTRDSVVYGGGATPCLGAIQAKASYTRAPDGTSTWRSHLKANPALAQSPGLRVDGGRF